MKKIYAIVFATALISSAVAQESRISWGVGVITEGQWNMTNGNGGWANRIDASFGVKLWKGGLFDIAGLATYSVGTPVADDFQGFSNIDAENRIRLVHAGLSQKLFDDKLTLFVGLRAADEDYFNTDLSGLFTGSSYGCFPVSGENHGIAVYPEAALGVHVEYTTNNWTFRESVYNGAPSDRIDEQFRFCPGSDGIFNAGSVMYAKESKEGFAPTSYTLGYTYSSEEVDGDSRCTLWGNVEQPLFNIGRSRLNLLASGAAELTKGAYCTGYWAAGLVAENITSNGGQLGAAVNRVYFIDGNETDIEVTFNCPIKWGLSIQPALHIINTDGDTSVVGQLRLCYEFGQ